MFTGIIEEVGSILAMPHDAQSYKIIIHASKVLENTKIGDSIAVNGVCVTVTDMTGQSFTADVMPETIRRTALGKLGRGSHVNLERAMAADGRFGGHIVSGHIDGTGTISGFYHEGNAVWVTVSADAGLLRYIVEKGSIAIDGISLTVAFADADCFRVSVIPHTGSETTLLLKKPGDVVNLECDIVGKYIEKLIKPDTGQENQSGLTLELLAEHGFLS